MSFIVHEMAALSESLCDELINLWDRAPETEVIYPDENRADLVQPVKESDCDKLKYEDHLGRVVYVIGDTNPDFEIISKYCTHAVPNHDDFKAISYVTIIQYPEETHMPYHKDDADTGDTGTVIFNLTDDFSGGNFHVDGHTFIPFLGSMIAFNDSVNRWHGVDPVFGGERFSLCIWYADPDSEKTKQWDDVEEEQEPTSEKKHNYAILPE